MKKWTKADILWAIVFLLGIGLLLYKARFGMATHDESFYLTIPYRLAQGDALCLDEWNLGQLALVVLCPFVWSYQQIFQTTDGLILAFRILYIVMHSATAGFVYMKLRKKSWTAGFASILYLLFAPFAIRALSGNTMGIGMTVIAGILLYLNEQRKPVNAFLAGLAFAEAVLCCPHLVLLYLVYGVASAINTARRGKDAILSLREYAWFTGGCAAAAIALFAFLFSRCTLEQFFEVLPHIMLDPEHPIATPLDMFRSYGRVLAYQTNENADLVLYGLALLLAVILLDKKREKRRAIYLTAAILLTVVFVAPFLIANDSYPRYPWANVNNVIMYPLVIVGIACYFMMPEALCREMVFLWMPGMIYGFCINGSSSQGFPAIADGATVAALGSIIMAGKVCTGISGRKLWKTVAYGATTCLLVSYILSMGTLRYVTLFDERGTMADMTWEITEGSHKGLLTSETYFNLYVDGWENTAPVREHSGEKVLYFSRHPWHYLNDTKRNASYSAWMAQADQSAAQKLMNYYQLNPEKIPDVAYFNKAEWPAGTELEQFLLDGFCREETEESYILTRK